MFSGASPKLNAEVSELLSAYREIDQAPDRSCAIVACALIEAALERAISWRFVADEAARKKLFGIDGGIGEFEPKIRLGYLLGIYTKETHSNLMALGQIRNRFAHRTMIRKFEHPDLRSFFEKLTLYRREHASELQNAFMPKPLKGRSTARERFLATVHMALSYFALDPFDHAPLNPPDPRF